MMCHWVCVGLGRFPDYTFIGSLLAWRVPKLRFLDFDGCADGNTARVLEGWVLPSSAPRGWKTTSVDELYGVLMDRPWPDGGGKNGPCAGQQESAISRLLGSRGPRARSDAPCHGLQIYPPTPTPSQSRSSL
jgi:hypothetical protein